MNNYNIDSCIERNYNSMGCIGGTTTVTVTMTSDESPRSSVSTGSMRFPAMPHTKGFQSPGLNDITI